MKYLKAIKSSLITTLSIVNVLLGLLASIVMLSGDSVSYLIDAQEGNRLSITETLFLGTILHPAMGTIYTALYTGFIVYQSKINDYKYKVTIHITLLALTFSILVYSVYLVY